MANKIQKISFYLRSDGNPNALSMKEEIISWVNEKYPEVKITEDNPEAIIVLGGDGTFMEAARKNAGGGVVLLGINLGTLGFLSSIPNPKDFKQELPKLFSGDFHLNNGMIISASVIRNGQEVFSTVSFNEIAVQNLLSTVSLRVSIEGETVQEVKGTGILVSTPAGSTAYNLSAHGPIIAPNIECFVLTELFDMGLPTPSLVIPTSETITISVVDFREHKLLKLSSGGHALDVVMLSDGAKPFVLEKGDSIVIKKSPKMFFIAMLERQYFYKNLRAKFKFN